jgi:pimeloyl-ACP methyl ester carboxylesterase
VSRPRRRASRAASLLVSLLVAAAACSSDAPSGPKGSRQLSIAGHAAVEQGSGTTAVIMIHGATTHKDSFYPLMPKIAGAGDWAIAYDYDSSGSGDIAEIVVYAKAHGAKRIVLVGSSLGAQNALTAADALHVAAVVTFSSEVEHAIKEPLLAIASEHDGSTATYAKHNADAAGPGSQLDIVSGSTHGIDLVHPHPEAMTTVTDWLAKTLG